MMYVFLCLSVHSRMHVPVCVMCACGYGFLQTYTHTTTLQRSIETIQCLEWSLNSRTWHLQLSRSTVVIIVVILLPPLIFAALFPATSPRRCLPNHRSFPDPQAPAHLLVLPSSSFALPITTLATSSYRTSHFLFSESLEYIFYILT